MAGRAGRRGRSPRSAGAAGDAETDSAAQADPLAEADPPAVADPAAVARAVVLRRLTIGPRTRAQLAADLARRGVPEEVGAAVLDRFGEVGLVDDAAFATAWVDSRHAGRGLARRALRHELRHRGVDEDVVGEALSRLDPDEEEATARALVRARLPATRGLDRAARTRRLAGLLARRGYPAGLAARVVREALAADGDGDGDGDGQSSGLTADQAGGETGDQADDHPGAWAPGWSG